MSKATVYCWINKGKGLFNQLKRLGRHSISGIKKCRLNWFLIEEKPMFPYTLENELYQSKGPVLASRSLDILEIGACRGVTLLPFCEDVSYKGLERELLLLRLVSEKEEKEMTRSFRSDR